VRRRVELPLIGGGSDMVFYLVTVAVAARNEV